MLRHLRLILWKNLVIRKRHWLLTITEVLIPIVLFTLVAYGRSKISGMNKFHVDEPTFHEITNLDDIYSHLDVGELNLWFTPSTNFTQSIIKKVQQKLAIRGDAVKEFRSHNDLLLQFGKNNSSLVAAVIFAGNDQQHLNYDLTIYDTYFSWNTDKLFIPMFAPEEARSSKYLYKGFVALQVAIDLSYLELNLEMDNNKISFSLQEFPDPPRTIDSGLNELFMCFLPLITIFSFIFLCPAVLQRVGEEKVSGTKEFLKMIGLKSFIIWLGWFFHGLITNLFSIVIVIILMKVPFFDVSYPPIEYSDGTVLFTFLFLYCMAAITFCFLIASIVNTPSIATVVGILIWIFSYFIPQAFVNSHEYLPWNYKILFGFLPNMALYYGYTSISVYEMRETGIQWNNIFKPGSGDGNDITMGNVFLMFIADMIVFMLLTLYIENVKPGEYGIAKSYSFPLTNLKKLLKRCISHRVNNLPESKLLTNQDVEKGNTPCIQIVNLYKKFSNHVAVDNLSMDIYRNRITVLLGENGAGKTTTMSILTGMINATDGLVLVDGKNIKKHTDEVRQLMGLCPQHNLLFPDLTVEEHLIFFAMLKSSGSTNLPVEEMLTTLGIADKKCELPNALSGGMKRKLCLGMALIGDSQVLVLDEPTSGMDPESRRKIWDLLLQCRKSKTILITTHFMEEADVLGDRIAIMANGRLQCYDTPMQLKAKYNTGYHLCLLLSSKEKMNEIEHKVKKYFFNARKILENDDSVVYLLPLLENGKCKDLIFDLENNQNNMHITSINMNVTTLNDVFLKANDEIDGRNENHEDAVVGTRLHELHSPSSQGCFGIGLKFLALIKKRIYFFKKKYYWFIPAILVTMCIFLLAIWLSMSNNDYYDAGGPSLNLTLEVYGKTKVYYGGSFNVNPIVTKMRNFFAETVSRENGHPVFTEDVSKGIINEGIANIAFFKKHMISAAEFNIGSDQNEIIVNAMYSPETRHGVPISINLAMNAVVKALLNDSYSINIINTPLKPLYTAYTPSELSVMNVATVWLILIPISMFFFMSNFIVFPNTEISTDFIQIQTIAGIKAYFYWFTNIVFDFISSLIPLVLLLCLLVLLNRVAYNGGAFRTTEICAIAAIFATYIFVSLPFTYLLSYRKTISGGFTLLIMLGIFTGIIPTLVIVAMEFSRDDYYMKTAEYLKTIFIVVCPQFALSYISVKFSKKYVENFNWQYMDPHKRNHICDTEPNPCCEAETSVGCYNYQNYFTSSKLGIQNDLLWMLVSFIIYFGLLLVLNSDIFKIVSHALKYSIGHQINHWVRWFRCEDIKKKTLKEDIKKKTRTNEGNINTNEEDHNRKRKHELNININEENNKKNQGTLRVRNLNKTFGEKIIVKNLGFQLKKNKCFGLLGVNGAGKSTTFRMLTKNLLFDKGSEIRLESENEPITISQPEYCEHIGYCPQEDCLNYFLTGRELLLTMASLKGYQPPETEKVTDCLLDSFGLKPYADKPCSEYSGGNKRKLSSCIAFLGFPKVILLDEPTSGVDPASRRKFWNILSSFKKLKDNKTTSFLLCSHSMEECENLCDEIAIMKDGEIKDQGTLLALKDKYQKGFKITITLKSGTDANKIKREIEAEMGAVLKEEYAEVLTYQLIDKTKKLSEVLSKLEELRETNADVVDYVINQISLEDIFLRVADNK